MQVSQSTDWHPNSWQKFKALQQANYANSSHLNAVIEELSSLPPLVSVREINELKQRIASAAQGESFILQGGDCAELFKECNAPTISSKLKIIMQMALVLVHGLNKPVIKIGRMAGQYAKPRSTENETINGVSLPCYRGDLINSPNFEAVSRQPDPDRLLKGYSFASLTLNYIRTLLKENFSDFSQIDSWNLDFISHSGSAREYQFILNEIKRSLALLNNLSGNEKFGRHNDRLFTSHEALHLHYEQALTRQSDEGQWFNLSTHLPWIGMRTGATNSAHVEYMRGINNPIGIKVGPSVKEQDLLELCELLDPTREPGRLTLITRLGHASIEQKLPRLIKAMQSQRRQPLWVCDPMHGNTIQTNNGVKTRRFDDILAELGLAFKIHNQNNSHLGGVHFELTGEHVTECIGGARGLSEADLSTAYKSLVDPRLNAEQALEMALKIVQLNSPQGISVKQNSNIHSFNKK
ncbi:3-deoxy-7-phosphoheptulonate synthase class II [Aliikangiella sp. IMCC44632]